MLSNVLELCKVESSEVEKTALVFKDLTRDMFKDNTKILNKYFRNESGSDCAFANLVRVKYELAKPTMYYIKKILKKDFGRDVSLKGYKYDPKHYMFKDIFTQLEYEEEYYRTPEAEMERNQELDNLISEGLDYEKLDTLYNVMRRALLVRTVIILGLDNVLSLINTAIEADLGGYNCSGYNYSISQHLKRVRQLLTSDEVQKWLLDGHSDLDFAEDENTVNDYIRTYHNCLRDLVGSDIELDAYLDLIHNPKDKFENRIATGLDNIQECSYYEDSYDEESYLD